MPGTKNTEVFDNQAYYRRISILAETVFIEAEIRAIERGKNAFINVIGCGKLFLYIFNNNKYNKVTGVLKLSHRF